MICSIIGSDNETDAIWKFFQAGEYVDRADADVAWSLPTSLFRSVVHGPAGGWDDGGSQTKYIGIQIKAKNFT